MKQLSDLILSTEAFLLAAKEVEHKICFEGVYLKLHKTLGLRYENIIGDPLYNSMNKGSDYYPIFFQSKRSKGLSRKCELIKEGSNLFVQEYNYMANRFLMEQGKNTNICF